MDNLNSIKIHRETHNEKEHDCITCNETFNNSKELKSHFNIMSHFDNLREKFKDV